MMEDFTRFHLSLGPKPVQKPHPQIYLGGASIPATFSRIARYANGWIGSVHGTLIHYKRCSCIEGARQELGRKDLKIILLEHPNITKPKERREPLTGTITEIVSDLKRLEEFGVDHVILSFRGGCI